jgi:Cu/Ag efflux protein CusF
MGIGSMGREPKAASGFILNAPSRETAMKHTKLVLAATAILTFAGSAAFAQDDLKGQVTQVNRLNNTVAIRPIQDGTVGANIAGSEQQFKVKDGVSLEDLHAGNRITYSVTDTGGTKMLTKFKVQ